MEAAELLCVERRDGAVCGDPVRDDGRLARRVSQRHVMQRRPARVVARSAAARNQKQPREEGEVAGPRGEVDRQEARRRRCVEVKLRVPQQPQRGRLVARLRLGEAQVVSRAEPMLVAQPVGRGGSLEEQPQRGQRAGAAREEERWQRVAALVVHLRLWTSRSLGGWRGAGLTAAA